MIVSEAVKAAGRLVAAVPFIGGSTSEKDYQDALELVDYLMDNDPLSPLLSILTDKIEKYEDSAAEFSEFNARIDAKPTGVALLRILMDQYQLTQSDFENEIGKKSQVSRVLKGDRSLTLEAIKRLSSRFNIPVQDFI